MTWPRARSKGHRGRVDRAKGAGGLDALVVVRVVAHDQEEAHAGAERLALGARVGLALGRGGRAGVGGGAPAAGEAAKGRGVKRG